MVVEQQRRAGWHFCDARNEPAARTALAGDEELPAHRTPGGETRVRPTLPFQLPLIDDDRPSRTHQTAPFSRLSLPTRDITRGLAQSHAFFVGQKRHGPYVGLGSSSTPVYHPRGVRRGLAGAAGGRTGAQAGGGGDGRARHQAGLVRRRLHRVRRGRASGPLAPCARRQAGVTGRWGEQLWLKLGCAAASALPISACRAVSRRPPPRRCSSRRPPGRKRTLPARPVAGSDRDHPLDAPAKPGSPRGAG